jgi:integrase
MVRLQLATGMRPSEVCNLRPMDIDKTGEVWMIRPSKHKTANRGIRKAVPLLGVSREIVENYLNRSPESYLFSPAEAVQWLNSKKRAERKTKVQPSQVCRKKKNPMKPPRDHYDSQSYGRAITRACKRAGIEHWTLYQLRHAAATKVTDELGVEFAAALLGHTNIKMTEHYSRTAERQSIEAAKKAPRI